jgi:coproporphyrinogen III oxidase
LRVLIDVLSVRLNGTAGPFPPPLIEQIRHSELSIAFGAFGIRRMVRSQTPIISPAQHLNYKLTALQTMIESVYPYLYAKNTTCLVRI